MLIDGGCVDSFQNVHSVETCQEILNEVNTRFVEFCKYPKQLIQPFHSQRKSYVENHGGGISQEKVSYDANGLYPETL